MSITANCSCGKKYQVKDDFAGKKFKCKDCGETVKVPAEQIDDLEDYEEDEEEEEDDFDAPVRRPKKRSSSGRSKSVKRRSTPAGPNPILRVTGILFGILGFIIAVLYYIAAFVFIIVLVMTISGRILLPLHLMVTVVLLAASIGLGFFTWRAAQAACNIEIEGSWTETLADNSRIIFGIVGIFLPTLCWTILKMML
jgi:hypothetical protein